MTADKPLVAVACELDAAQRSELARLLGDAADVVHIGALYRAARSEALQQATAVLCMRPEKDLQPGDRSAIANVRLLQVMSSGADTIRFADLPANITLASNKGAYAQPMAEHAMAMYLAAAKRLFVEHAEMTRGTFNQQRANKEVAGSTCAILGFGGIGVAIALLAKAFGMRVHAINRRGASDETVDWIGTPDQLPQLLEGADVLMICAPLTSDNRAAIGAAELARMKTDAVLVNVSRAEVIDEDALHAHLLANPGFTACLDAWWIEPARDGRFESRTSLLSLPNVIGSPHNSAYVPGIMLEGVRAAANNIRRVVEGGQPLHVVPADERLQ